MHNSEGAGDSEGCMRLRMVAQELKLELRLIEGELFQHQAAHAVPTIQSPANFRNPFIGF
jgi:hypothetical protein